MKLGKTLRKLRVEKGLTQDAISLYLGISRQAYCRYENDQREISLDFLCKLADLYEETTDFILGRE